MTIYEHRTTLVVAAGSATSVTLNIAGGIMHQLLVRANTDSTSFRVHFVDDNSLTRLSYGFHQGELNDVSTPFPLTGRYTIQVTNASLSDTFTLLLAARER